MVRLVSRLIAAVVGSILMLPIAMSAETAETLQTRAREALAQIEGQLALPGLSEPVEVLRDRWGVPHIYARNQDDLFFAQGVVAAQDRLFQMDLWRRAARGELAAVLGPSAIAGDRFARSIQYRGDAEAEWASYAPDARQIITAFTRGINAYIDSLGDRLPVEFVVLGFRPGHWQPEDCLGRMAGIVMTRNFRSEVERARLIAAVGVEKARLLAPPIQSGRLARPRVSTWGKSVPRSWPATKRPPSRSIGLAIPAGATIGSLTALCPLRASRCWPVIRIAA